MRSTEFKVTGFIDDILDPEDILIDGQELTIRAFRIHTRDGLVFESQSDADSVLDILGWGDLDSLYRAVGHVIMHEGHQVLQVTDLQKIDVDVISDVEAHAMSLDELRERAHINLRLPKADLLRLYDDYPEFLSISRFAIELELRRQHRHETGDIQRKKAVCWGCKADVSITSPSHLYRFRKAFCRACDENVAVRVVTARASKEERIAALERGKRAKAALAVLKAGGSMSEARDKTQGD